MTWETYYEKFYDWSESTAASYLSRLADFGPSAEVCEIAQMFSEEAAANRLIRKALAAGVRFTAEEIGELDGVVPESLMPQLVQTTSTPLTAEVLDELSDWLSDDELRALARKHGIVVDAYGQIVLPPTEEEKQQEREWEELGRTLDALAQERARKQKEELLLARFIIAARSINRRERREKRRKEREGN